MRQEKMKVSQSNYRDVECINFAFAFQERKINARKIRSHLSDLGHNRVYLHYHCYSATIRPLIVHPFSAIPMRKKVEFDFDLFDELTQFYSFFFLLILFSLHHQPHTHTPSFPPSPSSEFLYLILHSHTYTSSWLPSRSDSFWRI